MAQKTIHDEPITGVLLAGGQGRRMGGRDKFLLPLGRQSLLQRVIARASPQVDCLLLNINGDPQKVAAYPLTVVRDITAERGHLGPLAGILSAMHWAQNHSPQCRWLASMATDTPFFPPDLVIKLYRATRDANTLLAGARSAGRTHPVFALWSLSLYTDLESFLLRENRYRLHDFFDRHRHNWVDFSSHPVDPFFNINTPDDLNFARNMI